MDSEQRARLLRERFRAIGGTPYPADRPRKAKARRVEHTGPLTFSRAYPFGVARFDTHCQWVRQPDAPSEPLPFRKRRKGKSALQRIADKWRAPVMPRPTAQSPEAK